VQSTQTRLTIYLLLCVLGVPLLFCQGKKDLSASDPLDSSQAGQLRNLRENGAYQEAGRRAQEFLTTRSNSAILHLEYGRVLMEVGQYPDAEKQLRQCMNLVPTGSVIRMQAMRELGDLLEATGRRKEARLLWDQLLDRYRAGGVKGSQALGVIAVAAWRRGLAHDANEIFIDATDRKLGEVDLDVLADFGYLFLEKYHFTDAIGVFRDCLKMNKSYARALLGLALAKKYDGDLEVEAYSKEALKINPNLAGAWNALAEIAMEEEDHAAALEHLEAALRANPLNLESMSLQAFCHFAQGDIPGFSRLEKRVLEINPSCGKFYHIIADNLVSRRKYQEAVDWSRKAIALDPELWSAHLTLGMNLMRVGEFEGGRKSIQQAFEGDGFNVWAFNSLDLFDTMDSFARSRSEHFTFRMSEEDAVALGPYAPELAEEVYSKLTKRYGFKPEGPIQVEIFPDHGGFAVRTLGVTGLSGALGVCFGKVLAIDSPRARDKDTFNWGSTLWHEFAHVISLQMTKHNIPRWFSEGISVYEEHRARSGWGDNLTTGFLQAYKSGKLMKASELNAGFVRPESPGQVMLAYYQAGLVCEMIDELYGFDKIRQSLLLFAENKPSEEVFRQTIHLNPAQMDEVYAKYVASRFKQIAAQVQFAKPAAEHENILAPPDKSSLLAKLKNNPDDFWANLQLGRLFRKEGANADAEVCLKKAQQVFPQYVEEGNPYELLGEMYLEQKREEDALAQFKNWIKFDGTARVPLLKAADIYRSRKDWASAAEVLNLSIFINPYDLDVQKKLGDAAMENREWSVAVSAYRTRIGPNGPNLADAHYDLARALLALGNRQEARRALLKSLEIAPSYRKAQQLLLQLNGELE